MKVLSSLSSSPTLCLFSSSLPTVRPSSSCHTDAWRPFEALFFIYSLRSLFLSFFLFWVSRVSGPIASTAQSFIHGLSLNCREQYYCYSPCFIGRSNFQKLQMRTKTLVLASLSLLPIFSHPFIDLNINFGLAFIATTEQRRTKNITPSTLSL